MKQKIRSSALCVIIIIVATKCFGQKGLLADKDKRIEKYEYIMLDYLRKNDQFSDTTKKFSFENYKDRMIVRKKIEIYTGSDDVGWLIVRFQATTDHGAEYWGIMDNNNYYLFHSTKEDQFLLLRKKVDSETLKLMKYYCETFE